MEDLFGLIGTVLVFAFWIAQAVMNSKKKTKQEFDDAWKEFEEDRDEDDAEWLDDPEPSPAPPVRRDAPKPQPAAQPGAPTWKQLQQQLEDILKQNTQTQPVMPERRVEEKPLPTPPPRPQPSPVYASPAPARLDDYRPRKQPSSTQPIRPSRANVMRSEEFDFREKRKTKSKFPHLHPHPVYNALLLSEVVKPYSRNPIFAQRPNIGGRD